MGSVVRHPVILRNPIRAYNLLLQLDQLESGTARRSNMVTEEMNDVTDCNRLASRRVEVGRHGLKQHEWVRIDQNHPSARPKQAHCLSEEREEFIDVAR